MAEDFMKTGYTIRGADRLVFTLKRAKDATAELKEANKATGDMIAKAARPATPRRSGTLAASVRASKAKGWVAIRAGKKTVPYAGPIHWGWPARNIESQPWISATAQATEAAWLPKYVQNLEKILATVRGM